MNTLWLSLITSATVASPPPPPVQDCTTPSYGNQTYVKTPTNSLICTNDVVTSSEGSPGNPVIPSGVGAWKTHVDSPEELFNRFVPKVTSCESATLVTFSQIWTRARTTSKSRTQVNNGSASFIDGLFNYLKGVGWTGGVTSAASCSTTESMTIGNFILSSGQRRVGGWTDLTDKYYESVAATSGTTTGLRSEIFQWGSSYDSGTGLVDWTWDFCANDWIKPTTKPTLTACTATLTQTTF